MDNDFLQNMLNSDNELLNILKILKKYAGQTWTASDKDDLTATIEETPFGISFTEEQWSELQKISGILAENCKKKQILLQKILQVS